MAQITVSASQLSALSGFLRRVVRALRKLALFGLAGVAAIVALLARGGFGFGDAVVTILCLAPPAIVLFFAQGVLELVSLPDRLRKIPGEGQDRLAELARIAGEARTAGAKRAPLLLWRLRGAVGSLRDVAGIALPLRVLTPAFLGLAALAALVCVALVGVGLIALLVLAAG